MSKRIHVTNSHLKSVFEHVSLQIPKGNTTINLAIQVENNTLYLYTQEIMFYKANLGHVDCSDIYACVQYYDIHPFIGNASECDLSIDETGVTFEMDKFSTYFSNSYDIVSDESELPELDRFERIDSSVLDVQLKIFQRTFGIFRLYKHEFPVTIKDNFYVMRTPSIWFKGQCNLAINSILTADLVRLMAKLLPSHVYLKDNMLYIARDYYTAVLPVNTSFEDISFSDVHNNYIGKVSIPTSGLYNIASAIGTLPSNTISLAFGDNALGLSINTGYTHLTYKQGNLDAVKYTCELTKDMFCFLIKLYTGIESLDIYYKQNLLCIFGNNLLSLATTL